MKLINDLGSIEVISKSGDVRKRKMGLFECPKCLRHIQKCIYNGAKSGTCGSKECQSSRSFRHGWVGTSMYNSWAGMKQRCRNITCPSYKDYGAKGIGYPEKWENFKGFLEDMEQGWVQGLEIDRKKSDQSYSKENCRWLRKSQNIARVSEKAIAKYSKKGEFIISYSSAADAVRAGECKNSISITRVAAGKPGRKFYKGFIWKYV